MYTLYRVFRYVIAKDIQEVIEFAKIKRNFHSYNVFRNL